MQTLPFDPALGPAIPLPKNFTVEKQTADEIVIIGQKADTSATRNHHVRITFDVDNGWINRHCFKQEKLENFRIWGDKKDTWIKRGRGAKCCSDWIIKTLLEGDFL